MPIYEYRCESCGHELEAMQKMADAPLVECPACHQDALKKLISAAGFRLKGGGWYETDFKSGGKKNVAGDTSASGSSDAGASANSGTSSATTSATTSVSKESSSGNGGSGGCGDCA